MTAAWRKVLLGILFVLAGVMAGLAFDDPLVNGLTSAFLGVVGGVLFTTGVIEVVRDHRQQRMWDYLDKRWELDHSYHMAQVALWGYPWEVSMRLRPLVDDAYADCLAQIGGE